jgi:hypothetical protein
MPRRRRTRTQDRQYRILEERELNRLAIEEGRTHAMADVECEAELAEAQDDSDPPPF